MRAISASDSVSIAVQRTRDFLFRPFNWGTFLKLGLVAIITEGWGSNSSSSKNSRTPSGTGQMISPFDFPAEKIAVVVASILFAFVVVALLYYVVTRLRFAYFHCLVHNTKLIRPGWRMYREPATRFFWLNVWVGICFLMLVVVTALPFISGFVRLLQQMSQQGRPDFGLLLAVVLPLIPVIFALLLIGFLIDLVLRDLMLPHYALENATAGEAWGWVWRSIVNDKKQYIVYVLLRVVLPIVAMVGILIVLIIPGLLLAGAMGSIVYAIHSAFAASTGASAFVGILLQVFFGAIAFFFLVLLSICLGGPLSTWIREYAITFYGGRYQALGNILYPTPAGD